ncbi:hypothetical protein ACN4EK_10725 [Pantanalinema rosaneae CENA516]|uniref:hypothetical protein n=1 Tax=Pantanalinema rosaneae TaxID=1620701 RepID=UPI003D6E1EF6
MPQKYQPLLTLRSITEFMMQLSEEELATLNNMANHIFDHLPEPTLSQAMSSFQEKFALIDRECLSLRVIIQSFKEYIHLHLSGQEIEEAMAKFRKLMIAVEGTDEHQPIVYDRSKDPSEILDNLLLRFPEPERSIALAKNQDLINFTIEQVGKAQQDTYDYLPTFYVQLEKKYRIRAEITSILGVTEENCYSRETAIKSVMQALTVDVRRLEPTSDNIYWEAPSPEDGEYIEGSFTYTGTVFEEAIPYPYIYVHSSPPKMVTIENGIIQAEKNYDAPKDWPADFAKVITAFDGLLYIIKMLPEPEISIGWQKYTELTKYILGVTRKQTQSLLDTPVRYVQLAKEYQVGESTVRVLGLVFETGWSDEEALNKAKFLMTSEIAFSKLDPTSGIYWEAPIPKDRVYVEGSFSCTGVVYQAIPEQYAHQHFQSLAPEYVDERFTVDRLET